MELGLRNGNEGDHDRLNEVEAGRIELPSEIESQ